MQLRPITSALARVGAFIAVAACAASPHEPVNHRDDVVATTSELRSETTGDSCSAFMTVHFDRGLTIANALVHKSAFRACVLDRMTESYMDCSDSANATSAVDASNKLLLALGTGNHIGLTCNHRVGGACGAGGTCPLIPACNLDPDGNNDDCICRDNLRHQPGFRGRR